MSITVIVGRTEHGTDWALDLASPWHIAIQGMSRSGKSSLTYALLGAVARRSDVVVCGVDPTGILLNPWRGRPGGTWRALGGADMQAAATALQGVVAEMDHRISCLMADFRDKLDGFDSATPLLLVVLEEYPATLSAAEAEDLALGRKPADRVAPQIQRAVRRLVQEGAKTGVRVLLIAQRMDASIVGGAERSNFGARISMRVDNLDAVRMLHPTATAEILEKLERFSPGVALVDSPGVPRQIAKADLLAYRQYVRLVLGGGEGDVLA